MRYYTSTLILVGDTESTVDNLVRNGLLNVLKNCPYIRNVIYFIKYRGETQEVLARAEENFNALEEDLGRLHSEIVEHSNAEHEQQGWTLEAGTRC